VRIGIVADIHECVEPLARALAEFRRRGVDQIVNLGDACDMLSLGRAGEVVQLLHDHGAVGVWGNHDFGACYDVQEDVRQRTPREVLGYLSTMQPQLVLADCRFSHVEPWLDPHQIEELWYCEGPPDTAEKAHRSFAAVSERCLFIGHFHHWRVMTCQGEVPWDGVGPLKLQPPSRHLVLVSAVLEGWCGLYDTEESLLTPIPCGG
jgi:hypothetical protein